MHTHSFWNNPDYYYADWSLCCTHISCAPFNMVINNRDDSVFKNSPRRIDSTVFRLPCAQTKRHGTTTIFLINKGSVVVAKRCSKGIPLRHGREPPFCVRRVFRIDIFLLETKT